MDDRSWQEQLDSLLLQLQIVTLALAGGCVSFLVIALLLGPVGEPPRELPLLTAVALGAAVLAVIARLIVPRVLEVRVRGDILRAIREGEPRGGKASGETPDAESPPRGVPELLGLYSRQTIINGALLEGAAFFLLVAYFLEGAAISLAVAVLMILGIVLQTPTRAGLIRWTEEQLDKLREQRSLGR
jgi:hypothetical protein